jgi:hypothetical protein
MIHDLRQGLTRELLEVSIGAVLNFLFEQRSITLLILHLTVYVIPVECDAVVRSKDGDHRVIRAVQRRVRLDNIFAPQDNI